MAPSLLSVGAAALACVGSVSAKQWYLHDTYDATNFFDNFDFFSDADPNSGHVVYKTQEEATSLGIAKYDNDEVYLGVDYTNVLDSETGRPSVRLHSKEEFNHGLFIARFSHLPEPKCGAWPAFWSVGNTWPDDGEIDLIEGWNLATNNKPAFHTGDSDEFGTCMLDGENQSATVDTDNCDNTYQNTPDQYLNEGCTADDYDAPYGNSDGGVYALEWTDSYIKVFAWKWANVPDNLDSDEPDTDSWGTPSLYLKNDQCTIDDHFVDQTLIINIAFCGNPVGNDDIWAEACKAETSYDTCSEYVSAEASAFENTYFKIQDIRYFKAVKSESTSTSAAGVSTTESASVISTPYASAATSTFATETRVANTSIAATTTDSIQMTTSVVYGTQISTVTACPSSVTDCPVGSVVTQTVVLYTTVCPVTAAEATETASSGSGSGSGSDDSQTITQTLTNVYTITSCAASITNCPVGELSTEYITTTYCPGNGEGSAATTGSGSSGNGSNSGSGAETITKTLTNVYTITSCAASITNCPVGELSTEFITTTYEGSTATPDAGPNVPASKTGFFPAPAPSDTPAGTPVSYETPGAESTPIAVNTPVVINTPVASSAAGSSAAAEVPTVVYAPVATTPSTTPVAAGTSSSGSTASEVPATGSAGKTGASLALILGAVAAMMM